MSDTREREIENFLRHHLSEMGLVCVKFVPDHKNGMPDRLILLPDSRVLWVELKAQEGRLSEIQKYQHKELKDAGQEVAVVWSKEQACELLDMLEERLGT